MKRYSLFFITIASFLSLHPVVAGEHSKGFQPKLTEAGEGQRQKRIQERVYQMEREDKQNKLRVEFSIKKGYYNSDEFTSSLQPNKNYSHQQYNPFREDFGFDSETNVECIFKILDGRYSGEFYMKLPITLQVSDYWPNPGKAEEKEKRVTMEYVGDIAAELKSQRVYTSDVKDLIDSVINSTKGPKDKIGRTRFKLNEDVNPIQLIKDTEGEMLSSMEVMVDKKISYHISGKASLRNDYSILNLSYYCYDANEKDNSK